MREWELLGADAFRAEARCRGVLPPMTARQTLSTLPAVAIAAAFLTFLWVVGWLLCLNQPDPE